jgi:hypothetical protein
VSGPTAPETASAPSEPPPDRWPIALVAAALVVTGIGWFALHRHWWLNSDGSAYLSVGSHFLDSFRYSLPDGASLSWLNRPLFTLLLVAPWVVRRSVEASIWMSRLPLILAPPVVALATFRFTRSLPAAALAGLAALVQPWSLIAGGSNFVPDGAMAAALVAAVVCASCATATASPRARGWWLAAALLAVVIAAGSKQTGALGIVLVGYVLWVGLATPRRWLAVTAVPVLVAAMLGLVVLVNGAPVLDWGEIPRTFVDELVADPFADSALSAAVIGIGVVLIAWGLFHATEPLPAAGLALCAQGLALGLYSAGSGLGQRNAACLPYGACLLLGAALGAWLARPETIARAAAAALAVGAVIVLVAVSGTRAVTAAQADSLSWDAGTTRAVAAWLQANARDEPVGCSLLFCSFYWWSTDEGPTDLQLLPQYAARIGPTSFDGLDWNQRTGWRGPTDGSPRCRDDPLVVTKSDERFGVIFECGLLEYVRCATPRYLVVGGWDLGDTYDAGRLIPYLEANPAFRRVYTSALDDWPRVSAVYEVVAPPRPLRDPPAYMTEAAYRALRERPPRATVLDGDAYRAVIQSLWAQPADPPPADPGARRGAPDREGCPASLR